MPTAVVYDKINLVGAAAGGVSANVESAVRDTGHGPINNVRPAVLNIINPPGASCGCQRNIGKTFRAAAKRNRRARPVGRAIGWLRDDGFWRSDFGGG